MLIAEDLLLLLTDDQSGAPLADSTKLPSALAGAVLLELSLLNRIDVAGEGELVKRGRLVIRDSSPTGDDILDKALSTLSQREGKRPRDVIRHLARGLRDDVYDRLVGRQLVRREEGRILGVFPRNRWPAVDVTHEEALRRDIVEAVIKPSGEQKPNVGALVSLLTAVDKLTLVVPPHSYGLTKKDIRHRGKEITEGSWAPAAVKETVAAAQAAMIGAVAASTAVASTSS